MFVVLTLILSVLLASQADAETRKLKLYYLHTGEKATITYKKNGKFLSGGLKKINRFLRDWRRNEPTKMDPLLMDLIWEVYKKSGSKAYIHVISGYRSPSTNNMLRKRGRGVAKKSQHTLGKALDFFLPDVKLAKLRKIGLIKQVGGVGYYPRSGSPFVHMDTGRVRHWPRMSRKQLVRVFPNGKTLHVPTDGKPLPGYNKAVASFNSRKSSRKKVQIVKGDAKARKSFFQRLASRNRDDEDSATSNLPLPRKVKTTKKPVPAKPVTAKADDVPKPETVKPKIVAPVVAEPIPTPEEPPKTPELPLLASIPVPRVSPRQIALAPEVVNNDTVALAQLDKPDDLPVKDPDAEPDTLVETASISVPVPAIRPQFEPVLVAKADIAPVESPAQLSSDTSNKLREQLIAQAKNQLRGQLSPTPRPNVNIGPAFETALLPTEPETRINNAPVLTRSLAPAKPAQPATIDGAKLATGKLPLPQQNPEADQTPAKPPVSVVPAKRPQIQPPVTADIEDPDADKAEPDISPIILAAIPTASPRPNAPVARQPIQTASLQPQKPKARARNLNRAPKPLDQLSLQWSDEKQSGNIVLAKSITKEVGEKMRAPAYGRAAIRQKPKTVLSGGFVRAGTVQNSKTFTASAIQFQSFTKFN